MADLDGGFGAGGCWWVLMGLWSRPAGADGAVVVCWTGACPIKGDIPVAVTGAKIRKGDTGAACSGRGAMPDARSDRRPAPRGSRGEVRQDRPNIPRPKRPTENK